jgi:hypothetical protein
MRSTLLPLTLLLFFFIFSLSNTDTFRVGLCSMLDPYYDALTRTLE